MHYKLLIDSLEDKHEIDFLAYKINKYYNEHRLANLRGFLDHIVKRYFNNPKKFHAAKKLEALIYDRMIDDL